MKLVFIHGYLGDKRIWRDVIHHINTDIAVINFELAGFGDSIDYLQTHGTTDIEPRQQALYLHRLLSEHFPEEQDITHSSPSSNKNLPELIFVAHGAGAHVAREFVLNYGSIYNCKSIIFCAAPISLHLNWWDIILRLISFPIIGDVLAWTPNAVILFVVRFWLENFERNSRVVEELMRIFTNYQFLEFGVAAGLIKQLRAFAWYTDGTLIQSFVESTRGKFTFIHGSQDWLVPISRIDELFGEMKSASLTKKAVRESREVRFYRVNGGTHFVPLTHPEVVGEIISGLLEVGMRGGMSTSGERPRSVSESYEVI